MFFARTLKEALHSRPTRTFLVLSLFLGQLATPVSPSTPSQALYGQELGCLAMNIYQEGRSEPTKGKLAIAAVTMNRVASRHYPNNVCEVVWQPKQFSWTGLKTKYHVVKDAKAWQDALQLADLFLNGAQWPGVGNSMHYHTKAVQPKWSAKEQAIASIGNHLFYNL